MTKHTDEDDGELPDLLSVKLYDGDIEITDYDLMAEALAQFGVVVLAWRNLDGALECLLASESSGFKWTGIDSITKRPNLRAVQ